jgi:hypothetical protein
VLPTIERYRAVEAWIIDDTSFPKKGDGLDHQRPSILSRLSARTLPGSWSERTSYSRVHTKGGFEETIESRQGRLDADQDKHGTRRLALHFQGAGDPGKLRAMAVSQMNRPYGPAQSRRNQRTAQRERSRQASPKGVQRRCFSVEAWATPTIAEAYH